jgi:hypothetical protein
MRYDDIEMLKSLTHASTNTAGQNGTSLHRSFEDHTLREVDLFAMQKHAEMTVCNY